MKSSLKCKLENSSEVFKNLSVEIVVFLCEDGD